VKTKKAQSCLITLAVIIFGHASALRANEDLQAFDPKVPPNKAEWQHFHKMTDSEALKFWKFQKDRGAKSLRDWSWQWRMGWIKRCGGGLKESFCKGVLLDALLDNAMVIRAEAATSIGKRYAGRASAELLVALQNAYVDPRNTRNGNPLFVYERILETLAKLDDPRATQIANKLAASHQETKAYWGSISKAMPANQSKALRDRVF
jgi:hypothetical protein